MHITLRSTACALAAAGTLTLAACGGSGSDEDVVTSPAAPSAADVAGSDQHLRNLAEAGAADVSGGDAYLYNLNPFEAGNRATLAAEANRYVAQQQAQARRGRAERILAADAELAQEQANAAASARLGGYAEQYAEAHAAEAEQRAWARLDESLGIPLSHPGSVYSGGLRDPEDVERQAHLDGQARTYGR
jgi:hypothetical protein